MAETRIIVDLSRLLSNRLERGVRDVVADRPSRDISVFAISHVGDLEASDNSAIGLLLHDVRPDHQRRQVGHSVEADSGPVSSLTSPAFLRPAPLWLRCRYAVVIRAGGCYEEQELLGAVLHVLNDQPVVRREELSPLVAGTDTVDIDEAYELRIASEAELWRDLGLSAPRLLAAFEVSVPLPSRQRRELGRVFERDLRFGDLTQEGR